MSQNLSALASNDIIESLASTLVASLAPDSYRDAMAVENGQLVSSSLSPMMTPAALPSGWRPPPPDFLLHTQFVCDRVLLPIVVCVGIIGNILSLVVLTRKEMTSPTNCFLTALAISDISLLFLQVPLFFGLNAATAGRDSYKLFVRYYTVIMYVMTNVFITCTCWLTVAVTVERFLSLRFMMHPKVICSIKRGKRAILGIFFASFLFHFSKFFEYTPNTDLKSPAILLPTELSLNKKYDTAMHLANITLAALLPIVSLIIFNTFLIYFLATHRRRMLKHKSLGSVGMGTSGVDMLHVSAVVVAVVLAFVACHSLGVFLALNIAVHGRHRIFSDHLFVAFKHVNTLLVMVNSSINFLLYCSISRKFRKMFMSVFCKRFISRTSSWSVPVPLSENSMATAVSIRPANGYSRGSESAQSKEVSMARPSASSNSSRSADHAEI